MYFAVMENQKEQKDKTSDKSLGTLTELLWVVSGVAIMGYGLYSYFSFLRFLHVTSVTKCDGLDLD